MSDFYHVKKKWKWLLCKVTHSSYNDCVWTSENSKTVCAPLWMRAPSRVRAQSVMHTLKFWQLSSRNYQNVSRNITLHGDARDQFWVSILSSVMSKCSFINTYITLLLFECKYKTNFLIGKIRKLKSLFAFDACLRKTLVAFQLDRPEIYRQDSWCSPNRSI